MMVEKQTKEGRLRSTLTHLASEFLKEASDRSTMITVTDTRIDKRGKKARILVTVYPEEKEEQALQFLQRKHRDFRDYLKANARLRTIPYIEFAIDAGERNRQRVEAITDELFDTNE